MPKTKEILLEPLKKSVTIIENLDTYRGFAVELDAENYEIELTLHMEKSKGCSIEHVSESLLLREISENGNTKKVVVWGDKGHWIRTPMDQETHFQAFYYVTKDIIEKHPSSKELKDLAIVRVIVQWVKRGDYYK